MSDTLRLLAAYRAGADFVRPWYEVENPDVIIRGFDRWFVSVPDPQAAEIARLRERAQSPCGICGGACVTIRGRFPMSDKRVVCPTCLADRLALIHELSSREYGVPALAPESEEGKS